MFRFRRPLGAHTLRSRFAIAVGLLLVLAGVNLGASMWTANERASVHRDLQTAVERHSTLTEVNASLRDHHKRIRIASELLGVEASRLGEQESATIRRSLDRIGQRMQTATASSAPVDTTLIRLGADVASLLASWKSYYADVTTDPARAIVEVTTRAEPRAQQLLGKDLPDAIERELERVRAGSVFVADTDRVGYRTVWLLLLLTVVISASLAASLSRDFGRAVAALKSGVVRFTGGDLGHRVQVPECEELQGVARNLNRMAANLHKARDDIQQRNEELAHLAFRDPLTNLANRSMFRDRLDAAFEERDRRPEEVCVLFIDLDNFKGVNDSYGHEAGDLLLVDVAERLRHATRGSDTVARLGGDEFGVLLHRLPDAEANVVAERVLHAMRAPHARAGRIVPVSASIGIACGQSGEGANELMRNADLAMYRSKHRGRGQLTYFRPEMYDEELNRAELENDLAGACDRGELYLEYQPIFDLRTQRITAIETLVRWQHPARGLVVPNDFIGLAEDNGDIVPIGRWVMQQAFIQAAKWPAMDGAEPRITVNVSARQLEDPEFVSHVEEALARARLPAARVVLEITERVIVRDGPTLPALWELKRLGVQLAIDDFGTGYSSLASLQRFPVDILKIDKMFVDNLAHGNGDGALAKTIVAMGDALSLRTIAEGIEREDQREELLSLGCTEGQGFLFEHSLGAAVMTQRLERVVA